MYTAKIVRKLEIDSVNGVQERHNTLVAKFDFYDELPPKDREPVQERISDLLSNNPKSTFDSQKRLYGKNPSLLGVSPASFYPTHLFKPRSLLGFEFDVSFSSDDYTKDVDLDKLNNYILTGKIVSST
jgi:hypothetical protein